MSESQAPAAAESGVEPNPENDPEIAELLNFEPVPRRFKRGDDGWTAPLQRAFIRHLAQHGSPGKACDALQKHRSGIDKVYKSPGAESFRAAWARAVEIAERRAAARIEAEAAAMAGVKMPFRDNRRSGKVDPAPEPEPELDMDEDQKWDLMQGIAGKFMQKVAAERQARLAGEIVAADFYLRQITFIEVMFDLTATSLGFDPTEVLSQLRRGKHDITEIAGTGFSDWLDASRRVWWAEEGEPERPSHPDARFLEKHRSADGDYSTATDQHATGATTTPARGYTQEQWAGMSSEEQTLARARQFERDAAEQMEWEARARAQSEAWRAGVNESTEAKTNDGEADALA